MVITISAEEYFSPSSAVVCVFEQRKLCPCDKVRSRGLNGMVHWPCRVMTQTSLSKLVSSVPHLGSIKLCTHSASRLGKQTQPLRPAAVTPCSSPFPLHFHQSGRAHRSSLWRHEAEIKYETLSNCPAVVNNYAKRGFSVTVRRFCRVEEEI